jgi:hypothetical protein
MPDPRTGQARQVEQIIPLTTTDPGFGGVQYWFVDDGCQVGRLYRKRCFSPTFLLARRLAIFQPPQMSGWTHVGH